MSIGASYPYLDLRSSPVLLRPFRALQFVAIAWRYIEANGLHPRPTIYYHDDLGEKLGISPWPYTLPVSQSTLSRVGPIVIAIEDRRFLNRRGIDWRAIARAVTSNLRALRVRQGASTLTQQLVRNTLVYPSRSVLRKLVEWALAARIEKRFSKNEILQAYLGQVGLGPGVKGFDAALDLYHGVSASEATDHQLYAVAGCLRRPNVTSPLVDVTAYEHRANTVRRILKDEAQLRPLDVKLERRDSPRPRLAAICDLEARKLVNSNALSHNAQIRVIHTTINRRMQDTFDRHLRRALSNPKVEAAACLVIESKTGRVVSESSFGNDRDCEFSPAFFGTIQPGSVYKPFVLLEALEQGLDEKTMLISAPFSWTDPAFERGIWKVRNYAHSYLGVCDFSQALAKSDNTAFARLIQHLGPARVNARLKEFGLLPSSESHAAAGLGAVRNGTTLRSVARAYAALLNHGRLPQVHCVNGLQLYGDAHCILPPILESDWICAQRSSFEVLDRLLQFSGFAVGCRNIRGKSGTAGRNSLYAAYDDQFSYALWVGFHEPIVEAEYKGVRARGVLMNALQDLSGEGGFSI